MIDPIATVNTGQRLAPEEIQQSRRLHCRLAQAGPTTGFTGEMSCLLQTRLRIAVLIILAGFALHLLRMLLLQAPTLNHLGLRIFINAGEIVVLAIVSAVLWSRRSLSLDTLRILEMIIFGMLTAFFAWLQFDTYHDSALLSAIVDGQQAMVFRQVGMAVTLRWFLLIVLYGTFVPNTWQRCAAVTGIMALIPIALLLSQELVDAAVRPFVLSAVPEMAILLGMAVSIAVFGSHKIRELQQKAHEADQIGQYRLKQVIGFGGMGAVYLAEHVLLRRPCAVKIIRPDQAGDPRTLIRFEREVRATATLTHPNTVEIFDYGHAADGTFYYVMEYLPGMNLQDLVDRHGPIPPARAVYLLRQVCQALREAHGIGLIHRDIKPSNIFACERGKVYDVAKLFDFGLVKSFSPVANDVRVTLDGSFTGSPAFMSPEQASGRPGVDARSDIYNVGAVAYFLITGELLFDRDSFLEMIHAHAHEPLVITPEFEQTVPADLRQVILRCLEKDPARRYQDAGSLDKALGACVGAGQWTPENAEEWWQQHAEGIIPAVSSKAFGREAAAVAAP